MQLDLTGKNAFVGGSSAGIGQATAIELAKLGASVTLCGRNEVNLKKTLATLDISKNQEHLYICVDFSDENAVKFAAEKLATDRTIHILVNNTGGPPAGKIVAAEASDFLTALHNHLIINHLLAKTFLPKMKLAGWGRIINVISTSVKEPIENLGVSNTTRAAVAAWSKTLAGEVGQFGITVNNVLPGFTKTDRLEVILKNTAATSGQSIDAVSEMFKSYAPLRRFAEPEEVASVIAFLATPAAGYVSGVNLAVDGGRMRSL
jgi:3-oxoacyl-[acyl-carrier protein] reductase